MKRSRIVTCICLLAFSFAPVFGQSGPSPATAPAIVTLNFNAAVVATGEAQRDLGALQAKFAPREAQLQKLNDTVEAERKQLSDPAAKISDADRSTRTLALAAKEKQLQREAEDFKNDSQNESQQVFQRVAQKLFALLQDFAKQHGYSAVIERGTESAPVVWYAANDVDITERLAKAYDAKFGAASKAFPETPAPVAGDQRAKPKSQGSAPK